MGNPVDECAVKRQRPATLNVPVNIEPHGSSRLKL